MERYKLPCDAVKLCPTSEDRIIEMRLQSTSGKIVLYNGMEFETTPTTMKLLNNFKFDNRIRIYSIGARLDWFHHAEEIWETLNNVSNINFQGSFHQEVIDKLLQKCTCLKTCSFTYWSSYSFASILQNISSVMLVELSAHVNGTLSSFDEVNHSLNVLGNRYDKSIMRLILIFQEDLPLQLNLDQYCFKKFGNLLSIGAIVTLLFQREPEPTCMKTIFDKSGFTEDGHFYMAHNDHMFNDEHPKKQYELYRYYYKESNGVTWCIGCRKQPKVQVGVLPQSSDVEHVELQSIVEYPIYKASRETRTSNYTTVDYNQNELVPRVFDLTESNNVVPQTELQECCTFPKPMFLNDDINLCAPLWTSTLVQKLTYHANGRIEYFLTNGFYFKCCYGYPGIFMNFMNGRTTPRFVISSTDALTNVIIPYQLGFLLNSVQSFELHGSWMVESAKAVMERLQRSTRGLIFIRLCLNRRCQTEVNNHFFVLIDSMWPRFRENVSSFSCDTRDSEDSNSVDLINSITTATAPFNALQELVLIVKEIHPSLHECIQHVTKIVSIGSTVTIVFCHHINMDAIATYQFQVHTVVVPPIFSKRKTLMVDFFMKCYSFDVYGIHWHFVIPFPEEHKFY